MKFNEKLQKLRKEKGMSQESLAEKMNVSRQSISKWESGQSYPEIDKLIVLSDLFGITIDSLIKDSDIQDDPSNKSNNFREPLRRYWIPMHEYEYKSKRKMFGLPLVHINIGWGLKKAKGIIAIGNISTGIISIGFLAKGLLSLGLLSIGLIGIAPILSLGLLLSIGTIAIGTFAIGAIAIGVFALGAIAIGMFSFGALSIASHVAIGDHAYGHIAIGRIAKGARTIIDSSPNSDFSLIKAGEVREMILSEYPKIWRWIVDLMSSLFN